METAPRCQDNRPGFLIMATPVRFTAPDKSINSNSPEYRYSEPYQGKVPAAAQSIHMKPYSLLRFHAMLIKILTVITIIYRDFYEKL
jgi:hypothetical protein